MPVARSERLHICRGLQGRVCTECIRDVRTWDRSRKAPPMFVRPVGRLAAAVATVALLSTGLPTLQAQAATETYRTKATHAARWQSGQLTHGSIYNSTFGF